KHSKMILIAMCTIGILLPYQVMGAASSSAPAMVSNNCAKCHSGFKEMPDVMAGNFKSRSNKAKSIQLKINNRMELVKYTADTKVENVPNIKALKGTIPIRVHYKQVGADKVATEIVAKPKMEVPKDQLMSVEELAKLVAQGPKKGGYTLVDSRPGIKFQGGHIPTSISIPFPKMKEMKDKLPKDKNQMLIFYCEGMR
ncbi:rhodanese-like domain-containing protein, partial [Thermodesulfobacteriota bacterium]